jgi:uncharacterized protein with PIN domain
VFYVKETINDAVEVTIEIADNVFCRCPKCGVEVEVDLSEFIGDKDFDLYGSAVCCEKCSKKFFREVAK